MLTTRRTKAFTLIELLVVIAIIALLIGILLPALGAARKSAQALKAGANARNIMQGLLIYSSTNQDYFPLAYAYPDTEDGFNWTWEEQYGNSTRLGTGYVHWSYFLFDNNVPGDAFASPGTTNDGAPRTNWGSNPDDSELWQVSDFGDQGGSTTEIEDRQVPRLGFTVNGAIVPRNKLNEIDRSSTARENVLVRVDQIDRSSTTIVAAEIEDRFEWRTMAGANEFTPSGNGGSDLVDSVVSKSHRPVDPFLSLEGSTDVYDIGNVNYPRKAFRYMDPDDIYTEEQLRDPGFMQLVINQAGNQLNAISRAHNGKSNFSFVDGHTGLHSVKETVEQGLWGDRYYSLTQSIEGTARGAQNTAVYTWDEWVRLGGDGG